MNSNSTQVIEISTGILEDMVAQFLYATGKVKHSTDIIKIRFPEVFKNSMPLEVETETKREVKLIHHNDAQLQIRD
jgi:hypothetical protein